MKNSMSLTSRTNFAKCKSQDMFVKQPCLTKVVLIKLFNQRKIRKVLVFQNMNKINNWIRFSSQTMQDRKKRRLQMHCYENTRWAPYWRIIVHPHFSKLGLCTFLIRLYHTIFFLLSSKLYFLCRTKNFIYGPKEIHWK